MYILIIIVDDNCYLYPYSSKDIGKCEFNKLLDYLNPPDKEWHKDIQYYRGDKIEVTLDWYEDNDTVDLEVLK